MARNSGSLIARPSKASGTGMTMKATQSTGPSLADERRFKSLQRRLEAEGYSQGFGAESMALTEKLLDDLVEIRVTHKTLIDQIHALQSNEQRLHRQIQPLQKELSRVVRENNQLHLELIQKGEDLENLNKKSTLQEKKLASEVTDKSFVIHQQFQQICHLEQEILSHKDRIEQLLDKNFTTTPGPTGDRMPKGQHMQISEALRLPAANGSGFKVVQDVRDLEDETSLQISALKDQLDSFGIVRQELESQISSLAQAVKNRESEIQRMGKLLETSINSEVEQLTHELEEKADIIRRLTGQIDFLTAQVIDTDSHGKVDKGVNGSRDREFAALRSREAELLGLLEAAERENRRLQEAMKNEKFSEDSGANGDASDGGLFALELAAAKAKEKELIASLAASEREKIGLLEALGKKVPDSRDRHSIDQQLLLYEKQLVSMEDALARSKQVAASYKMQLNEALSEADSLREQVLTASENNPEPLLTSGPDSLKGLRRQCEELSEENAVLVGKLEESRQRCSLVQDEANEMRRLRDGLAAVVVDFENQLIMVQENIRDLYCDRDSKQSKIDELTVSLQRAEEDLRKQQQNISKSSQILSSQDATIDRRYSNDDERHAEEGLSQRLQASNANISVLQVQLETALADLRACSAKEKSVSLQLQDAQALCAEKESAIRQLQTLMAHLDETRGDVASRLQAYIEENTALKERMQTLENEVQSLQVELKRRDDDVDRARSAISTVDGERDSLLLQLEDRAERIQKLETTRADLEQKQAHSLSSFMTAQQQADLLRQALSERDGQVRTLQDQLDAECKRRAALEGQLAMRLEESQNLTSDLSIMTRENQVVNTELATLVSQREALKRDLDEAFERLSVAEQLVQGREKERDDVLMSYRALNDEKVRAEASLERCSSECHQLRAQVPRL
jgi:chromosome segregation ATPase